MNSRGSSLNPYAASYVPLSKRVADAGTSVTEKYLKNQDRQFLNSGNPSNQVHNKSNPASSSHSLSSQNVGEFFPDDDPDMDIEFLRMKFPGISEQSLRDVYMVCGEDLDAAIDMLTQLEFDSDESSSSLPETLDIGDVSESRVTVESASLKQKNVAEASTSSKLSPNAS